MRVEKITIWNENEYHYPLAAGFIPNIHTYFHEDSSIRPLVLVVPGGAYLRVSASEGEVAAMRFYAAGFHAAVLTYTVNPLIRTPLKQQPMQDLSRAIRLLRKNAATMHLDPHRISICGFSAGGHLCAIQAVHFEDVKDPDAALDRISCCPDSVMLCYPVITSGTYTHQITMDALLGKNATQEELNYMSAELHVREDTPPCFIWQTVTDEAVPVENAMLFAAACRRCNVPFALHLFSQGRHGLSTGDEAWIKKDLRKLYTMEQPYRLLEMVKKGSLPLDREEEELFLNMYKDGYMPDKEPNQEVASWTALATQWLKIL